MQHTSKMLLVPESAYSVLLNQQKQEVSPITQKLAKLDEEIHKILYDRTLPADIKFEKYENLFRRYRILKEEQNKPLEVSVKNNEEKHEFTEGLQKVTEHWDSAPYEKPKSVLNDIIKFQPKSSKSQAKILIDHIQNNPKIQWNTKNELIVNGHAVDGSNLIDLVNDLARNRPNVIAPLGSAELAKILKDTNVPQSAIVNKARMENEIDFGTTIPPHSSDVPATSQSVQFQTPLKTRSGNNYNRPAEQSKSSKKRQQRKNKAIANQHGSGRFGIKMWK